jgi:NADH-quinone oxidoreductase subunit A
MSGIAYHYLPILLFFVVGIVFAFIFVGAPVVVSKLAGTSKPDTIKLSEYESGFPAFSDSRGQFDVRFYLVAILFIVFDLEAAFLFPWAVSLQWSGQPGWWAMMEFLAELALGLAYAWKVGALEWE